MGIKLLNWFKDDFCRCSVTQVGNVIRVTGFREGDEPALLHHEIPNTLPFDMKIQTVVSASNGTISFGLGFGEIIEFLGHALREVNWERNEIGLTTGSGYLSPVNKAPQLKRTRQPVDVGVRDPFVFGPEGSVRFTKNRYPIRRRSVFIRITGKPESSCEFEIPEMLADNRYSVVDTIHWSLCLPLVPEVPLGEMNLGGKTFDELILAIHNLKPKRVHVYYDQVLEESNFHSWYLRLLEFHQDIQGFDLKNLKIEMPQSHFTEVAKNQTVSATDLTNYEKMDEVDKK